MPLEDGIFTLGNGVKLKLKKPSAVAAEGIQSRRLVEDAEPKPPTVWIEDKQRDEPNPQDPIYKAAFLAWTQRTGMRVTETLLLTGTELEGELPDGIFGPDSVDFEDWVEALGVPLHFYASKYQRYLAWLKYYATTDDEFQEVSTELVKLAGVSEEHIREAEETFRNLAFGNSDSPSSSE